VEYHPKRRGAARILKALNVAGYWIVPSAELGDQ
jgi:hypothetical protein